MRAFLCLWGVFATTYHDDLLKFGWRQDDLVILHDAVGDVSWSGLKSIIDHLPSFFDDLRERYRTAGVDFDRLVHDLRLGLNDQLVRKRQLPSEPVVLLHSRITSDCAPLLDPAAPSRKQTKRFFEISRDPALFQSALQKLNDDLFAEKTWASMSSQVRLYRGACLDHDVVAFPITVTSLNIFVALLKAALYKSAPQYISGIFRYQRLMVLPVDEVIQDRAKLLLRSWSRGIGDHHQVEPLTAEHLFLMRKYVYSPKYKMFFLLLVVQFFFLLRSQEVLDIHPKHCVFSNLHVVLDTPFASRRKASVKLLVSDTKTNIRSRKIYRGHSCVCGSDISELPICPVHALLALITLSGLAKNSDQPFGEYTYHQYLNALRVLLAAACIVGNFATHSLRRGGAQALCIAGWSLEAIKYFGRWLSACVEVYLLDAPLRASSFNLAASMVSRISGGSGVASKIDSSYDQTFGPGELCVNSRCRLYLPEFMPASFRAVDDSLSSDAFEENRDAHCISAWIDVSIRSLEPQPNDFSSFRLHRSVHLDPTGRRFVSALHGDAHASPSARILAFSAATEDAEAILICDINEVPMIRDT